MVKSVLVLVFFSIDNIYISSSLHFAQCCQLPIVLVSPVLVTSVPRARTQISNVTIIHVGYRRGARARVRRGISFIIYISPGCLNELSDTGRVWGQPRPAQLSDPVYIEPQERSVSVSGFS